MDRAWKLVDRKGSQLGVVHLPGRLSARIEERSGYVHFEIVVDPHVRPWNYSGFGDMARELQVTCRTAAFLRIGRPDDSVELHGLTPEELDVLPGFAFSPSMAYVRRTLAAEAERARVETLRLARERMGHPIGPDGKRHMTAAAKEAMDAALALRRADPAAFEAGRRDRAARRKRRSRAQLARAGV